MSKLPLLFSFVFMLLGFVAQAQDYKSEKLVPDPKAKMSSKIPGEVGKVKGFQADYTEAVLNTYLDSTQVAIIPSKNVFKDKTVSVVVFNPYTKNPTTLRMELGKDNLAEFFTADGTKLVTGKLLSGTCTVAYKAPKNAKVNWGKVIICLKKIYRSDMGAWCKNQCTSCFSNPKVGSCSSCAGCLFVSIAYCLKQ